MPEYDGAGGARLHYDVRGDGPGAPLIVLGGGAARHPDYLGDLGGLGRRHRLVVPHLRGVGGSGAAELLPWWDQAADIERLRVSLGLDRCVLVGHSAGTRSAMAYAAQFPGRLAALLLITPPAAYLVDVPSDIPALAATRMGEPAFAAAMAAWEAGPDLGAGADADEAFNAWQQATAPVAFATWDAAAQAHARTGRYALAANRAYLSVDAPADLPARLKSVPAPALVVAGAQDVITGVAQLVALADLFPNGRATVIDRCSHYPWFEQPAAFRAAVEPFLAAAE